MPFPTLKTTVGFGLEATYGTAVAAAAFQPVNGAPKPSDKLKMEEDKGWRGSAGEDYQLIPGVYHTEYDFGGNVYTDTIGYPLAGVLGDVVYSGGTIAPTGTLASGASAGATSVSSSVSIPNGTRIQIDVGVLSEVVVTTGAPTGAGPYAIPVPALKYTHLSGVAITAITTPYVSTFSLYNGGNFQPPSFTITDNYGVNCRQYPGAIFSEVGFKFPAEGLLTFAAKAMALPSIPITAPVASYTGVKATANWTGVTKFAGVTTGVKLLSGDLNIKRKVTPIQLVNAQQAPANIWAAALGVDFKFELVMEDDTHLTNYLTNVQPSFDVAFQTGAGVNQTGITLHMTNAGYTVADIDRGKDYVVATVSGKGLFYTTDIGNSGGFSPVKVTLQNAVLAGAYK